MEKKLNDTQNYEDAIRDDMLRALGEHSAEIIHELRGPLAALSANIQTLHRLLVKQGGEGHEERFAVLNTELQRMQELLDQYLLLAGRRELQTGAVELRRCAEQTLLLLRCLLLRQGIEPVLRCEGELLPVEADERQIKQILFNLIINALEALPAQGGRLELVLSGDAAAQHLLIRDNGSGISAEVLPHLFDMFFTTKKRGSGLGLPISRRLARSFGGELSAAPAPGGGADFLLSFPTAG